MKKSKVPTTPIIYITLLLLPFFANAQGQKTLTAKINWGNEYVEPPSTRVSKIVEVNGQGVYVLREKSATGLQARPKVYLEYFDRNMKLKKSVEQELKYKNKQRDFEDLIMLNDQLYLLTSYFNEAKKRNFLFKQKIGSRSLLPSRTLDMIADSEARNSENEGKFDLHISRDSSHLLVYNELPYNRREPERFALRVFDKQFEEIWNKNIVLPYADNQMTVEEYRVDNQGNVYLLGVIYQDGAKERRRGSANYQYVILAYTNSGEEFAEYKIDIGDKFITDLTFRVADDGNLVCTGFYSERGNYSVKGTYFFRLNTKTKEVFNKNLKAFDFEFLTSYMRPKEIEKARKAERTGDDKRKAELYNFALDDLILRNDGGAVLVAEQFYVYEEQEFDNFGVGFNRFGNPNNAVRTNYFYNYNDIIVVNIRPTGEIEWTARIPKKQETVNDGGYYSSYAMSIQPTGLYFLYNDNARNFDDKKPGRIYNFSGNDSVMTVAQIQKDGNVTIFPIFDKNGSGAIIRPKICEQIGKKEMAIYGERGKYFQFGSLKF
jgi:hypothetical protein